MAPKAKKGVVQPTKPTPAAPISFYGGSAARPQLVKRGDGFVRTGAEAANAPLIDWASKAKYADGGAKVAPANRPPRLPFKSYALYVKECREALLNDPETRAMYRDGMPAAVLMAEAQAKARAGWKELSEEARGAYQAAAVEDTARFEKEMGAYLQANPGYQRSSGGGRMARKGGRKAGPKPSKMPRGRGAFQIYVAECYADDGGSKAAATSGGAKKPLAKAPAVDKPPAAAVGGGLAAYLAFQKECRASWDKLSVAQRETYEQLAAAEKKDASEARKALRAKVPASQRKRKAAAGGKKNQAPRKQQRQKEEEEALSSSDDDDGSEYEDAGSELPGVGYDSDLEAQLAALGDDAQGDDGDDEDDVSDGEMRAADAAELRRAAPRKEHGCGGKPAAGGKGKRKAGAAVAEPPAGAARGRRGQQQQEEDPAAKRTRKAASAPGKENTGGKAGNAAATAGKGTAQRKGDKMPATVDLLPREYSGKYDFPGDSVVPPPAAKGRQTRPRATRA